MRKLFLVTSHLERQLITRRIPKWSEKDMKLLDSPLNFWTDSKLNLNKQKALLAIISNTGHTVLNYLHKSNKMVP